MIVLDTNVLSEPLRQRPHAGVVAWLDAQAVETLYLTTISLAELRYGVAVLPDGKRRQILHDSIEREVLPAFATRTLSFDEDATAAYAILRAEHARRARLSATSMRSSPRSPGCEASPSRPATPKPSERLVSR